MGPWRLRALALLLPFVVACRGDQPEPLPETQPSPNASIMPAPLASPADLVTAPAGSTTAVGIPADSAGRLVVPDPTPPPPKPASVHQPLPPDRLTAKDGVGLTLTGSWAWASVPGSHQAAEVDSRAIEQAVEATALTMTIDLAYVGRMRVVLDSAAFPLPASTELRARADRYGHALVWPSGKAYRVMAPGSLRAVFAERRADVSPVMRAKAKRLGDGTLLGLKTEKVLLSTAVGKVTLEQALVEGSGSAGALLCRFFVELVAIEPSSEECEEDRVPLSAHFEWRDGGRIGFTVDAVDNRQDLPAALIVVPPRGARFQPGELPPTSAGIFLDRGQLAAFRKRPVAVQAGDGAPGEGLLAVNHTPTLKYVLLDGVPIAWVMPHGERYVIGPRPGRYSLSWRDFFGKEVTPAQTVALPVRAELGKELDGGQNAP